MCCESYTYYLYTDPPQPPELEEFPHSPLYAPVGSDLLLDCVYSSTANLNNYISWLLSNDTELKPIAEDPTCTVRYSIT